ncbi:MAG: hypothetical protein QM765_20500 [Myxococcales bacterium]
MANKLREIEAATQADIDAALRPFIQTFVQPHKRERAISLFLPLKRRARPRELVASLRMEAVIRLDGSAQTERALARIAPDLAGVYVVGKPAAFRTSFLQARHLRGFAYGDEEIFVAHGGGCALVNFEIGVDWLIAAR